MGSLSCIIPSINALVYMYIDIGACQVMVCVELMNNGDNLLVHTPKLEMLAKKYV